MRKWAFKTLGRIISLIGLLLILLVMIVCLPMTAPRLMGYDVYAIISGSMEPALPVGSLVYAKGVDPIALTPGTVIVFGSGAGTDDAITHRVVENNRENRELVTRGDANADNDVSPIPYDNVIGQVTAFVPILGKFLPALSTTTGKLYLLGVLAAGVLFRVLGGILLKNGRRVEEQKPITAETAAQAPTPAATSSAASVAASAATVVTPNPTVKPEESPVSDPAPAAKTVAASAAVSTPAVKKAAAPATAKEKAASKTDPKPKKKKSGFVNALLVVMIVALSGGVIYAVGQMTTKVMSNFMDNVIHDSLAQQVVTEAPEVEEIPETLGPIPQQETPEPGPEYDEVAPISVDWDELMEINSEVVGWLYMPDTVINYPVMQTTDNDYYLHRDMNGNYSAAGTLFVDVFSMPKVIRSNYIIYGHHMASGSMFASLDKYSDPSYYDEHKKLYYLTPEGNYRVELIAACVVESIQENYPSYFMGLEEYQAYLDSIVERSTFVTEAEVSTNYQLMSLSTCNYSSGYNDPRMLVQGMMIPIG